MNDEFIPNNGQMKTDSKQRDLFLSTGIIVFFLEDQIRINGVDEVKHCSKN